jgi:hypothetical protein
VLTVIAAARGRRGSRTALAALVVTSGLAWEGAPVLWVAITGAAIALVAAGHQRQAGRVAAGLGGGSVALAVAVVGSGWQPLLVPAGAGALASVCVGALLVARGSWRVAGGAAGASLVAVVVWGLPLLAAGWVAVWADRLVGLVPAGAVFVGVALGISYTEYRVLTAATRWLSSD